MNLQEAYKVMQANCGIEVGDTVRVLREFYDNESGSRVHWDNLIERLVGTTGVVKAAYDDDDAACMRVVFENKEQWSFPFFVLELVKKGKKLPDPLEISSDKHVVFCEGGEINLGIHHLDFDTLEEIYLTAKGVKES